MWQSSDPLQTAAVDVANAVFPYDYRGVRPALARVPADSYARAAQELLDRRPGVVLLITGFPIQGIAETDGPPGAAAVGRALRELSWHVVTVVDPMTRPVIEALGRDLGEIEEIDAVGLAQAETATGRLLDRVRPHAAIAIERPGLTADGRLANMRGETLDPSPVPMDGLLRVPISIGVGDGGNELGLGSPGQLHAPAPHLAGSLRHPRPARVAGVRQQLGRLRIHRHAGNAGGAAADADRG